MCGHLVSICSGIPSLPEPSSTPEAVFLIVCNSPLQMSWPYSKTPGAWFLIFSLGLTIKSAPHLFSATGTSNIIGCAGQQPLRGSSFDPFTDNLLVTGSPQSQEPCVMSMHELDQYMTFGACYLQHFRGSPVFVLLPLWQGVRGEAILSFSL